MEVLGWFIVLAILSGVGYYVVMFALLVWYGVCDLVGVVSKWLALH